jgi:hypothetical protein
MRGGPTGGGKQKRWLVLDPMHCTLAYYRNKDARSMFKEMDEDGSGTLDMGEVDKLCKLLGKKLSRPGLTRGVHFCVREP